MVNKTVGIRVGPVHSRNKVNHQNRFVPQAVLLRTGKVNIPSARPQPVPTGKPKVFAPVPTGRQNRPFPVPTDRGYSPSIISGINGQLLLSPQQVVLGNHIEKENPFPDVEDEGVFDSGYSRSMTGNKERLDDFQVFQGRKVTFGGGEGRITGKAKIQTPTLDFKNVYYVKELQQFNLFSISQICNKKNRVLFTDTECLVLSNDFKLPEDSMVVLKVPRKHNLYTINLNNLCPRGNLACLVANASVDEFVEWHRRLVHVNYKNMNQLVKGNLVRGLPSKLFKNDHTCVACCKGKQHKASYKAINVHKDETYPIFKDFINLVENQLNKKVKAIRYDNGTEFKNAHIIELCGSKGIKREYSNARTPQQNRVTERKNRILIEAARTMLADFKLPTMFWTEAVRTACYVLNRVLVTSPHNKTPYALLTGNIPSVSYFKPFGCHVTILNTSDHLGKFDGKADEGYIVGYSASNKAYRVYNVPNKMVEETMNLRYLKEKLNVQVLGHEWYFDLDYLTNTLGYKHDKANQSSGTQEATTNIAGTQDANLDSDYDEQVIIVPSYPSHNIQGTEPKDTSGDEVDDSPLNFVDEIFQKELTRLKGQEQRATSDAERLGLGFANDAEELQKRVSAKAVPPGSIPVPTGSIPVPAGDTMVSTDDAPVHTSSSTDLFFDDEPTTRFLSLSDLGNHDPSPGIFSYLSYDDEFGAALNNIASTVEMDVKSVFLYERIDEEVYITQPKGFVDPQHLKKVYKVVKALYGLYQAPRAWYATLSTFLLKHGYRRGTINKTLFLNKNKRDIILVQVYVDDIIFESTKKAWCDEFEALMKGEFQMSAMGELTFFLGLQVQQRPNGMFMSQDKYVQEILNKFDLGSVRKATTPYEAPKPKSKNESDSPVYVHLYRSMIGLLMYLTASRPDIMFTVNACSRNQVTPTSSNLEAMKKIYLKGQPKLGLWRLISWQCKKQTIMVTSSTEAEYVAAANCCGQPNGSRGWISDFQVLYMDQVALL
nr:hypothetical protein [Tanacetum cinerariifolium]